MERLYYLPWGEQDWLLSIDVKRWDYNRGERNRQRIITQMRFKHTFQPFGCILGSEQRDNGLPQLAKGPSAITSRQWAQNWRSEFYDHSAACSYTRTHEPMMSFPVPSDEPALGLEGYHNSWWSDPYSKASTIDYEGWSSCLLMMKL